MTPSVTAGSPPWATRRARRPAAGALAPKVQRAWGITPASSQFWLALTAYNVALGLALALGDPARILGQSFATIRDYGGATAWGVGLVAVGAAIAVGPFVRMRALAGALTAAAVLHLLLAAGFIAAATASPQAAITGPCTYTFVAAVHALHARHYWRTAALPAPTP